VALKWLHIANLSYHTAPSALFHHDCFAKVVSIEVVKSIVAQAGSRSVHVPETIVNPASAPHYELYM
jgi:hypothetical protein